MATRRPLNGSKCSKAWMLYIYIYMFCTIWEFAQSRDRAAHSQNPEIACQSRDCVAPVRNLEIAWHWCTIPRTVACTIEPIKFPSYIKVRDVFNKLLQLCCHLQCRACILKSPHQGLLGSSPTQRNSLPLGLGTGAERSQTCGVPPIQGITISESSQLSSVSQLGR